MKAVVLDGYTLNPGDLSWEPLEKLMDVTIYDRTTYSKEDLSLVIERAQDAEVIFTNKTPITKEVIEALPKLKYIGMLSTGYDVVDVSAAKDNNIVVTNIPTYGTSSVAQMATALLLEMCHHVGEHNHSVKQGEWSRNKDWCYWKHPLVELEGKKIGIVGYGRIGRAFGEVVQSLGMQVLAYDKYPDKSLESDTLAYKSWEEVVSEADVISLHTPLFDETYQMINKQSIEKMKKGVMIINTSRGPLINEEDLAAALNEGKVGGAALDVVSKEPIEENNPLLTAPNCIITPHISWGTKEARERLLNISVENVKSFLESQTQNVVNS
ncbi:D-2-hydroxyacid dehydrogenase [Alkalicoccus saliphilus]|uniref:Glycerate dehydrogenase n=1 Tax=Alkalicoccus saliphilus TaxID=200989 RepID=A0A2T4U4P4_9BACI|nr:D-2-hydroxyacid dehydrogenase [Alkalicoccus saliphilus]PTL38376.1 glycerate dehydrogenase [Alkalicoccus saliphilus]